MHFVRSMDEIGLACDLELIVGGNHTLEGGEEAFAKLLNGPLRPRAVLFSNDTRGMGVMQRCYSEKTEVPQDLSVSGFDNTPLSQYPPPPLTTIEMSQTELGSLAFQAL